MISYSVLAGELGETFFLDSGEPFRYVKIQSVCYGLGDKPHQDEYKIPVHAFGGEKSSFYTIPKGSRIILRGWMETRDELGVVIVSELEELFPKRAESSSSRQKSASKAQLI